MMKRLSIISLVILFTACKHGVQEPVKTDMDNKPMSHFDILLPDSSYFNTANLATAKKTVIFYYSPTCPYCRAQMREMISQIDEYKDVQLCVLTGGDFASMKAFNTYFKLDKYPNIITGIDTGNVIVWKYQATVVPFTAVFDQNKQLIASYRGRLTGKMLLSATLQ